MATSITKFICKTCFKCGFVKDSIICVNCQMRNHVTCCTPIAQCLRLTRVFLFPGFSTSRETENFQLISREFREIFGISKILEISGIREIPGKFFREIFLSVIILLFLLIFSISDLIFSIWLCCFDKLGLNFSIFSTNRKKNRRHKHFVMKNFANFEK